MNGTLRVNDNGNLAKISGTQEELKGALDSYKGQGTAVQKGNRVTVTRSNGSTIKIDYKTDK